MSQNMKGESHYTTALDAYPVLKDWVSQYRAVNAVQPKYYIRTFGCQQNEADSEIMAGILEDAGFLPTDSYATGDLILINTCSVRANAEDRFFGHLGSLKQFAGEKGRRIIGTCGCMMTQDIHRSRIEQSFRFVDFIMRPDQISSLLSLIEDGLIHKSIYYTEDRSTKFHENLPISRQRKYRALVSIMYGCNNYCSYCIVPYTRGRERSRQPKDILQEIMHVAAEGIPEVLLLGQNVNAWGKDFADQKQQNFAWLLSKVSEIKSIRRIRFMTSHPKDLSDQLIETIGRIEQIEPHVHLPLQSGSNRILTKMNRQYSREQYLEIVNKLREARPGLSISTDIIVGFPGEELADFIDTIDVMDRVRFDSAFTFIYSPRIGTPASEWYNPIDREVIQERFEHLVELQNEHSLTANMKLIGHNVEVLCEGRSSGDKTILSGRTADNRLVNFIPQDKNRTDASSNIIPATDREGEFIPVHITAAKTFTLLGEEICP